MQTGSLNIWYFAKQWTVIFWCFFILQDSELRFVYIMSYDTLIIWFSNIFIFWKQVVLMFDILQNNELWYSDVFIFCKTVSWDLFIFCRTRICDTLIYLYFAKQWVVFFLHILQNRHFWYFHFFQNSELWHFDILIFCKTMINDTLIFSFLQNSELSYSEISKFCYFAK